MYHWVWGQPVDGATQSNSWKQKTVIVTLLTFCKFNFLITTAVNGWFRVGLPVYLDLFKFLIFFSEIILILLFIISNQSMIIINLALEVRRNYSAIYTSKLRLGRSGDSSPCVYLLVLSELFLSISDKKSAEKSQFSIVQRS